MANIIEEARRTGHIHHILNEIYRRYRKIYDFNEPNINYFLTKRECVSDELIQFVLTCDENRPEPLPNIEIENKARELIELHHKLSKSI